MRKQQIFIATVVALGSLGFGLVAARPAQQPPTTAAKSTDTIQAVLPKLLWSDERIVSAKIPGRIDRRIVDDGAFVEEGDALAELDFREAELENARQQLVADSEIAEKIARETFEEYVQRRDSNDRLIKTRAIPYEEWRLGIVQATINKFKVDQEVEKSLIEKNKAEQTRIILDEHYIRSPIRGRVQKCFKRAKESVTPNDLQLFRIVSTDKLWVEGYVADRYAFSVIKDQGVTVRLVFRDSDGAVIRLPQSDQAFEGKLIFIDTDVDRNNRQFLVRAEVENRDNILRAGFECRMDIHLSSSAPAAESN